ncbi:hypothetical protein GQX73_g4895 [Xylaria multiplex]|uniref:Uncharacterized protein n=1 Tax=Xylaria multiplex TaxID=323545 RepID=A0A7C8ISG4_9PEZI|nr:hypothetical protein GQX73_g4895 [Xylaria multiplex]
MDQSSNQPVEDGISSSSARLAKLMPGLNVIEAKIKEIEAAKAKAEEIALEWEQKYNETEEKLKELEKEYEKQASQNWALNNKVKDRDVEIQILQSELQNSIPLGDWEHPPPKLRTALELAQQKMITNLQREKEALRETTEHSEQGRAPSHRDE